MIERDDKCLAAYVEGVQGLLRRRGVSAKVFATFGRRYVRVTVQHPHQRVVHTFVDRATGNVHRAHGWKAPDPKNPRSNIFSSDCGLSGVNWTGAKYLKEMER
jgi:hypothetical protein